LKFVLKVVGVVVVVVALVCATLYFLNDRGWLTGSLKGLVDSITGHVTSIGTETKDYLEDEGFICTPEPSLEPVESLDPVETEPAG